MSVTINASTSSGLVMTSDLSGNLQFQNNGTSLPMGGVAPAFSAYQSSAQSLSNGTFTKIQFQTKEFDTNSNYDNTTNYRFTPTVAGYYQVNGALNPNITIASSLVILTIYKNGSRFKDLQAATPSSNGIVVSGNALIYLNGSTDYVELYGYQTSGSSTTISNTAYGTYFQACLVRGTP